MLRCVGAGNEEAPVDEAVDQNDLHRYQGPSVLFTVPALPLSRKTLAFVSGIIRATGLRSGRAGGS